MLLVVCTSWVVIGCTRGRNWTTPAPLTVAVGLSLKGHVNTAIRYPIGGMYVTAIVSRVIHGKNVDRIHVALCMLRIKISVQVAPTDCLSVITAENKF